MMTPYTTHWAAACLMLWAAAAPAQTQNALDFDGIDDEVIVPNGSALVAGVNGFSMTCWIKPTAGAEHHGIVGLRDEAVADFYMLKLQNTNSLEGRFRNSTGTFFTLTFPGLVLDAWQHLALVFDGSQLILYHNGAQVSSVAASGGITSTTGTFHIGNLPYNLDNFNFDGPIDEVSLWSVALTAQQVGCIASSQIDMATPGLELYYTMDQGVAGGNNTGITSLVDAMGNGNGTFTNMTLQGASSNFVQGATLGNTVQAFLCDGETYEFDGQELSEPGVYTATFPTSGACDSIVVLQLAVAEVDNGVVQNGSTLIATASEAEFQWYNCGPSGNTPIVGATAQYYQATEVGQYAVEVTQDGCSLLSECLTVTTIGIEELDVPLFTLSPIPAVDVLNVELTRPVREAQFTVLDMTGRALVQRNLGGARKLRLEVADLPSGAYFLRMQADGEDRVRRFVRE